MGRRGEGRGEAAGTWRGKEGLLFPFSTVSRVISRTTTAIDYNCDSDIPETFQHEKLCLVSFFLSPSPSGVRWKSGAKGAAPLKLSRKHSLKTHLVINCTWLREPGVKINC